MGGNAVVLDGKKVAGQIRAQLKEEIEKLKQKPGLAAIIVGANPASKMYVDIKERNCREVGIHSERHNLPDETPEDELLALIRKLNSSDNIHGILVQLPLPPHISRERVFSVIATEKDVDGFTDYNVGRLFAGDEEMVPCTPKGVVKLLEAYGVDVSGKNVAVIGRSTIVGRPLALMLINRNATVTVCHSKTGNLAERTRAADILISAAGHPKLITAGMVKKGAVVVDIGTTVIGGRLRGDVDYENVKGIASFITPVPGGIGPMTVAMLLLNTLECYKRIHKIKK